MFSNLIKLRDSLGLNQKEFAKEIGLKANTYNNYETGERTPSTDFFEMVSKKYCVSTDFLLGLTNEPRPHYKKDPPAPATASIGDSRLDDIVERYQEMNEDGKARLHEEAAMYADNPRYKKRSDISGKNIG